MLTRPDVKTYKRHMANETVAVSIKLAKEVHKRFKLYAVEKGVTFKDIFINHMNKLIAEEEAKTK